MGHRIATERLQASGVHVETELAVTKRNLISRVAPLNVVARYKGVPVNPNAGRIRLLGLSCLQVPNRC